MLALLTALAATSLGPRSIWFLPIAVVLLVSRVHWAGAVVGVVTFSALLSAPTLLQPGRFAAEVVLVSDATTAAYGRWAVGRVGAARVFLDLPPGTEAILGDRLVIDGHVVERTTTRSGREMSIVEVDSYRHLGSSDEFYIRMGNQVRAIVQRRLLNGSPERGLLAGFLVGDTSQVDAVTLQAMRTSGLSHFVAVSGSNVALYLGFVAALSLAFGVGPRRRAAAGLMALPIFVVATRFEPSVMRATFMAGLILVGKLVGYQLEAWQVVSIAVISLAVLDPWLMTTVGFQLSLLATCGVIVGSRWPTSGGWGARSLLVTGAAQLAVAPLIMWYFDAVPLLSPLTNLFAAPLVATATFLAVVGVIGATPLLVPGSWLASLVIEVADTASVWPQVEVGDLWKVAALGITAALAWRWRRDLVILGLSVIVLIAIVPVQEELSAGQVAVLDVGQGDAILLAGGDGRYTLVDGGVDPALLMGHLRQFRVRELDLVVVTHGDADHAAGLSGLFGRVAIGEIWLTTDRHATASLRAVLALATRFGIQVAMPAPGDVRNLGVLKLEVVGPLRRYESPNDQSIVIRAVGIRRSMLLTGDIEVTAQRELSGVTADFLKVPHHGAGTSDAVWLESVGASEVAISVGDNTFGHPVEWVVDVFIESGARIHRTDVEGNVVFDLGG